MQVKKKEKAEIANYGTEHMVRTANNKTLHRKLVPTQVKLQGSPKRHKQRKVRECVGTITETKEGIICESKPKARKVDTDEEDTDIECFLKSDGKLVHLDIDKKVNNWNTPTVALLPNRIEEDRINQNGEKSDGTEILVYADQTEFLNHPRKKQPKKNHRNRDWWRWRRLIGTTIRTKTSTG